MTSQPRSRRRKLLVHPRLQIRFLVLLAVQMGVILTTLVLLANSHLDRIAQIAASVPLVDSARQISLQAGLVGGIHGFYIRTLVLLTMTALLLLLFGLLASHKLAGPVVKLERFMSAVADGDYSQRIAFRRKDHLDAFANQVNLLVDSLENRRSRLREAAVRLMSLTEHDETDVATLERMEMVAKEMREVVR